MAKIDPLKCRPLPQTPSPLTTCLCLMEYMLSACTSQASVSCVSHVVEEGREVGGAGGSGLESTISAKERVCFIKSVMSSNENL